MSTYFCKHMLQYDEFATLFQRKEIQTFEMVFCSYRLMDQDDQYVNSVPQTKNDSHIYSSKGSNIY